MQIDYNKITKHNRNMEELLLFLLWCTVTPGKKSETITPLFNRLFVKHKPSELIRSPDNVLLNALKGASLGQYGRLLKCWKTISRIKPLEQLTKVTRNELTKIPGIGPKTASMFIIHSQSKWSEHAVLDIHILRWLQEQFPKYPMPEQTPQKIEEYEQLEAMFLGKACQMDMSASELDNYIWKLNTTSS